MGIDITYQAMPANARLLERSRRDEQFGNYIPSFDIYAAETEARIRHMKHDPLALEFFKEAKLLAQQHPDLEKRYLFGGRNWDKLHYLLSPYRRAGKFADPADWVRSAIFGTEVLNEKILETVWYSPPDHVLLYSERFNGVTTETLRTHWNVSAMIEAAVYKMHESDDETSLEWIMKSLEELKEFYSVAALHGEAVIVSRF